MPLLSSPIDGSPMKEVERYGVKIDICTASGGIWLDKGELEKIIHMIREEALSESQGEEDRGESQGHYEDRDRQPKRRRDRDSAFEQIIDLFDF